MSLVTLYHGTTSPAARKLLKQRRWDPETFGRGADRRFKAGKAGVFGIGQPVGFYGKGLYLTSTPEAAGNYAQLHGKGTVLEIDVEGNDIVWADSLSDDEILQYKIATIVEGRRQRGRAPMGQAEMEEAARAELSVESEKVRTIRAYAESNGLGGVAYSPYEIVIWGDDVIRDVRLHE